MSAHAASPSGEQAVIWQGTVRPLSAVSLNPEASRPRSFTRARQTSVRDQPRGLKTTSAAPPRGARRPAAVSTRPAR